MEKTEGNTFVRDALLVLLSLALFTGMVMVVFSTPFPLNLALPFGFMLATYLLVRVFAGNGRSA